MHEAVARSGQWQKKKKKKHDLLGKHLGKDRMMYGRQQKSGRGTLWKIVVCVALLVFLVSGGLTLRSYLADKRAQEEYERLAREAAQTTQETITIEETEKQELETEPEKKEEYQSPYDFDTLKRGKS